MRLAARRQVPRLLGQTFNGESNVVGEIIQSPTAEKWKEFSMSTRMDYTQIAAKLDYAALEKKLEQLTQREPPRKRKTAADVLEPLRERLLALRRKGWKTGELAEELKAGRRAGESGVLARVPEPLDCGRRRRHQVAHAPPTEIRSVKHPADDYNGSCRTEQ